MKCRCLFKFILFFIGWVGLSYFNVYAVRAGILTSLEAAVIDTAYILGGAIWAALPPRTPQGGTP